MRQGRMLCWSLALALAYGASVFGQAQNGLVGSDPDIQRLDGQVREFFGTLAEGRVDEAFDELLIDSPALERSPAIIDLKKNAQEVERRFGAHLGNEQIRARRVGQDVIVLKYLYKCERFPVVWYFTFYRTPDVEESTVPSMTWRLIALRFDTQIEQLAFEDT